MNNERKAPKDWKTWSDFANNYDLVLFNQCVNLVHQDSTSNFEGVTLQWLEVHSCDAQDAEYHLETCDVDEETETCTECEQYKNDYGDCPECNCEPAQWYAIAINEYDQKFLNDTFGMDIFYSDTLDLYILPVYHFGTSWTHVNLSRIEITCTHLDCSNTVEEIADECKECYKKQA